MKYKIFSIIFFVLFSSTSLDAVSKQIDEKEFGSYVFDFVVKEYKQKKFSKSEDHLIIVSGEAQLGLESLFKKYEDSESSKDEFMVVLKEHFDGIFNTLDVAIKSESISWEEARKILRPMFAPLEYARKIDILHIKIDSNVMATYVLDSEKGYKYVTEKDLEKWGVSEQIVKDSAVRNLGDASKNTPMQGNLDQVKFLVVQSHDGYDAARLLVPGFREFIASKLGYPFYAGIPNRDFLIMWSIENPEEMKSGFATTIESDFREKPYPLTPNVLEITKDKVALFNKSHLTKTSSRPK